MKLTWKVALFGLVGLFACVFLLTSKKDKRSQNHDDLVQENQSSVNSQNRSTASESNSEKKAEEAVLPTTALAVSAGKPKDLESFLVAMDPAGERFVSRNDNGRVTQISRLSIKGQSETPERMLDFARTVAEYAGTPPEQVVPSPTQLEDTPFSKAKQYDQEYEGYEVFGGYMKVFTKTSDGSVYFVANETKDVGDIDLRIKYSFEEAKSIALNKYADKDGESVTNNPSKPVIFNIRPGQSELAWEVQVQIQGPLFDRRHILISATSGMILKDITMLKN